MTFPDAGPSSPLPDSFFRSLLPQIDSLPELKVTVYALWRVEHMEGPFRALSEAEFDPRELGLSAEEVRLGLEAAHRRGSLLRSEHEAQALYFINSPEGHSAAQAFAEHGWPDAAGIASRPLERPNVFRLYEENIGPLTPLIADALNDAEATYGPQWVGEAIELAVKHNKRSWKYCEAILKRWKEEGRAEKQSGRDDQASFQHDVEDKIKKFIDGTGG
jgi:DnaD/phage-associated family protein